MQKAMRAHRGSGRDTVNTAMGGAVRGRWGRQLVAGLGVLMPGRWRPALYRRLLGWDVHPTAAIGLSLFLGVDHLQVGERAQVGHFNVFRNLRSVSIGGYAEIGQLNWFSAGRPFLDEGGEGIGVVRIGAHAAVTSRHYVDCSGGVELGDFALIAGVRSVVLTHFIDVTINRQRVAGVRVGERTVVSSSVTVLPGTDIPPRSQIAAGAVVRGALEEPERLYAGVPAIPVRGVSGRFFERTVGHVDP